MIQVITPKGQPGPQVKITRERPKVYNVLTTTNGYQWLVHLTDRLSRVRVIRDAFVKIGYRHVRETSRD